MANKKPIVMESGAQEELRDIDTLAVENVSASVSMVIPEGTVTTQGVGSVRINGGVFQADLGTGFEDIGPSSEGTDIVDGTGAANASAKIAYLSASGAVGYVTGVGQTFDLGPLGFNNILNLEASVTMTAYNASVSQISCVPYISGTNVIVQINVMTFDTDTINHCEIDNTSLDPIENGSFIDEIQLKVIFD
jgi:hypothetical protein